MEGRKSGDGVAVFGIELDIGIAADVRARGQRRCVARIEGLEAAPCTVAVVVGIVAYAADPKPQVFTRLAVFGGQIEPVETAAASRGTKVAATTDFRGEPLNAYLA